MLVKLQIKGQNHTNVDVESSKILMNIIEDFYDEHKNIQMEITSEKTNTYLKTAYHEGAYSKTLLIIVCMSRTSQSC